MSNAPQESDPPATIPLSVFRGESPQEPAGETTPELSELLEAWQTATSRLEKTHAQLRDEVARLTSELEGKNRELARKSRLADLGEMASHVAHEVRNSLTPITLYMSLLRRSLSGDAQGLDVLAKAEAGFTALEATVNDLLSFSSHRLPQPSHFDVGNLVQEVTDSISPQLEAQAVQIELDVPPNSIIQADREMLRRAVLNLLLNSLDAMQEGGDLVITACETFDGFDLEIADSGPGIDHAIESRLFEPFYSTKETGTGLGLSVVAHAAEAHGGTVLVENCPQGGAAFTIRIPRAIAQEAAA